VQLDGADGCCFEVSPQNGMITAGSKQDFSVSFAPTEAKVTISTAVFTF